ncbi:MAG: CorA family divalent cation transporter, partial [Rickettsiales bacterium]
MAKYINYFKETVSKQLNWQHFDLNNADLVNLLEVNVVELDNITRAILCADETRPRILQLKAGYILILRAINLNLNATPEDMVSIRFFVTENNIYSFSKRRLKAIDDVRELLKQKNELNNGEEFVLLFVNCLLNSLTPFMQDLAEQIEQIEDKIIAERIADNRQKILTLRKQIFTIKRYLR